MALCKQVNRILLLSSQTIFRSTSARNLRSRLTAAVAECHFEGSEFKKEHYLQNLFEVYHPYWKENQNLIFHSENKLS
jgi:hypothetical protein